MKPRALVIDDDVEIIRTVGDILDSLNHDHDSAGDQVTAWRFLETAKYNYILLDLDIPVKAGKLCRVENGEKLLLQIRNTPEMKSVPVIVMTGHGNDSPDQAVSVLKDGAVDYVKKPFGKGQPDKAIRDVLAKDDQATPVVRNKSEPKGLMLFKAETREVVIYDDRVNLCGIQVWTDCAYPEMGLILRKLSVRTRDGYVRIKGPKLNEDLGRDASNPVSKFIKRFRDNCRSKMASCRGLECGMHDVIGDPKRGGYHLTETIDVRIEDGKGRVVEQPCSEQVEHSLNERQQWVLGQIDHGARIGQKDVLVHFFGKWSPSTIKRDLKELRAQKVITTGKNGYYSRPPGRG